jgi:DNA polymerase III delta subunit
MRREYSMLKPLTPEDRKKAREAFNEVMNTHDEDPLAIAASVTVQSLRLAKKTGKEDEKRKPDQSAVEATNPAAGSNGPSANALEQQ